MPNRLADETSPYLLQHAHNPVDWYPWGADAFALARHEDKPILLSVGYSACHWCHVMERESFENADTAALMNELFVNVKVDREERPDVDSIYMQATQAMIGHGGWPMTVFLTPELEPFWAGTYFPPQDRPGMPSFQRVLRAVRAAYDEREEDVQRVAASMREMFDRLQQSAASGGHALTRELLQRARHALLANHDDTLGGFSGAPKFPHTMALEFLLTQWARSADDASLDAARASFLHMARGGIYDQLGGGFARYSVDERWLVPHFEKMLYDNALLVRLGVHLWQATHDAEIKRVVDETIEWLRREMTSPTGGFYSALDADSEGEEGKFYVWTDAELRALLGADADEAIAYWGASPQGNFEGHNILHVADATRPRSAAIERARATLMQARSARVRPGRDDKILAAWNGLMLRAVADAARAFGSAEPRALAIANGEFLFREMVREARVFRSHKEGRSRIHGFLDDHAALALGALSLYELTFETQWLERARMLADSIVTWFADQSGALFDTPADAEALLTRPRDATDNATPSGTSLAAELFLRIGELYGDADFTRRGAALLESQAEAMTRYPLAFGHALTAADMLVHGAIEVAIVCRSPKDGAALTRTVGETFVPSLVLVGGDADLPLLRDRRAIDAATAYVCRGSVCDQPTSDAALLREQLRAASRA